MKVKNNYFYPLKSLFLLLFFSYESQSAVHVFMGFMDEEVSPILKTLIEKSGQQIYVIERGKKIIPLQGIFENSLESYYEERQEIPEPKLVQLSLDQDPKPSGDVLMDQIAQKLKTSIVSFKDAICSADIPTASKKWDKDLSLSVLRFDPISTSSTEPQDIILLVRSPEMGLQATMMRPVLKSVLDPFLKNPENVERGDRIHQALEDGESYLHVFGTSGAMSDSKPNSTVNVQNSFFVGIRKNEDSFQSDIHWVKYNEPHSPQTLLLNTRKKAIADPDQALKAAQSSWRESQIALDLQEAQQIQAFTSLTVCYFAGDEDKRAGHRLAKTVNMEDSHILTLAKEYHMGNRLTLKRLNCDPADIPHKVSQKIKKWVKKPEKYSQEAYVDAIMWGLMGKQERYLTGKMHWTALNSLDKKDRDAYVVFKKLRHHKNFILDPFLNEIGTDFLSEAARPIDPTKPTGAGSIFQSNDPNHRFNHFGALRRPLRDAINQLTEPQRTLLNELMAIKSARIRDLAQQIRNNSGNLSRQQIRHQIVQLLNEAGSLNLSQGYLSDYQTDYPKFFGNDLPHDFNAKVEELWKKLLSKLKKPQTQRSAGLVLEKTQIRILSTERKNGKGELFDAWIRLGKWNGNQGRIATQLFRQFPGCKEPLDPECIDRMSYKHGLAFYTKNAGEDFTSEELTKMAEQRQHRHSIATSTCHSSSSLQPLSNQIESTLSQLEAIQQRGNVSNLPHPQSKSPTNPSL